MNQKQINKLEMFQSTNEFLDDNTAVWSAIPVVSGYKNQLAQAIIDIRESAQSQEAAQVYIGGSLRHLKKQVADKMDILDDILEAYAEDIEDEELRVQAANSSTDYFRLPNEDFETKTKNVIALLETHTDGMADYGMTTGQIDDAKLTFSQYQDRRGKPRSYQIASKVATQSLDELFKAAGNYINRLDKVMKRFKRSNTRFYHGYQAARQVIDD